MSKKNPTYELQRRQHKHEERMRILEIMAKDPEMKYFLGVALGGATGMIGKALGSALTGTNVNTEAEVEQTVPWQWVMFAAAPGTLTLWEAIWQSSNTSGTGMFGYIPRMLDLAGTGFAGFCATVLLMKSIFGDEDVSGLMTGMGTVADAAMPL